MIRKLALVSVVVCLFVLSGIQEVNSQSAISERDFRNAQSYVAFADTAFTAADSILNIESEANRGFILLSLCINPGTATTADYVDWQLFRTTSVSSGGTLIGSESSTPSGLVNLYNQRNTAWSGVVRSGGTEGTSGTLIDAGTLYVPTPTGVGNSEFCHHYCTRGTQCPYIPKGITNGVKLMFTGTAGGGDQTGRIEFIAME